MTLAAAGDIAPIITALIALTAVCIAYRAMTVQRDVARRRAAVDFFLKTEMDSHVVAMYEKFRDAVRELPTLMNRDDLCKSEEYYDIRNYLNICELISVGINQEAFSERVSYAYWGNVLPQCYQLSMPLIRYIRANPQEGTAITYCDLERLCARWKKKREAIATIQPPVPDPSAPTR